MAVLYSPMHCAGLFVLEFMRSADWSLTFGIRRCGAYLEQTVADQQRVASSASGMQCFDQISDQLALASREGKVICGNFLRLSIEQSRVRGSRFKREVRTRMLGPFS
jgi:hypothetical protein